MVKPNCINQIVSTIMIAGGRALLVGGAIIDSIRGHQIKDWDIEVYGLSYSDLMDLFPDGKLVGQSFGILTLSKNGVDIDLSIPRKENRIGRGHREFEVELLSDLTPTEAGLRRDLTINSMYIDLDTDEMIDPFGGLSDLENGILRATCDETFIEDALRVMRIAQFLSRGKGHTVDTNTIELCKSMVADAKYISKERWMAEFFKLLVKGSRPSLGLNFLRTVGWIPGVFPEIGSLTGCEQNPAWHPEGDAWNHTMLVCDNMASFASDVDEKRALTLGLAALCHDLGKPITSVVEDGIITSKGHDIAGEDPTRSFLSRITDDKKLIESVVALVVNHMRSGSIFRATDIKNIRKPWAKLYRRLSECGVDLEDLGLLNKADHFGTGNEIEDHPLSIECFRWNAEFKSSIELDPLAPLVMGRDLIGAGLKPSPRFKVLLDEAFELQLDGLSKEEILKKIL